MCCKIHINIYVVKFRNYINKGITCQNVVFKILASVSVLNVNMTSVCDDQNSTQRYQWRFNVNIFLKTCLMPGCSCTMFINFLAVFSFRDDNVTCKTSNEKPPGQAFEVSSAHCVCSFRACCNWIQGQQNYAKPFGNVLFFLQAFWHTCIVH